MTVLIFALRVEACDLMARFFPAPTFQAYPEEDRMRVSESGNSDCEWRICFLLHAQCAVSGCYLALVLPLITFAKVLRLAIVLYVLMVILGNDWSRSHSFQNGPSSAMDCRWHPLLSIGMVSRS